MGYDFDADDFFPSDEDLDRESEAHLLALDEGWDFQHYGFDG